ncbi:PIN domain-containing protein [bacterium]|nr:MAG: PIN domain-containing protein [bacterium]
MNRKRSGHLTLADSNFWLALSIQQHPNREVSVRWFGLQSETASVLMCRSTQQSFLRLLTTESVFRPLGVLPMTNAEAWTIYSAFLSDRRVGFEVEPPQTEAIWRSLTDRQTASPKLWMDAYLAAFAMAGGYSFVTTDRGFRQYEGLDVAIL